MSVSKRTSLKKLGGFKPRANLDHTWAWIVVTNYDFLGHLSISVDHFELFTTTTCFGTLRPTSFWS